IDDAGNWRGVDRVDLGISPFEPDGPAEIDGPGADAAASLYVPPQVIRLTFQNGAAQSFQMDSSQVTVFENAVVLSEANALSFDAKAGALVAPLATPTRVLEAITRSKIYRLSGKAELQAAAWSLPLGFALPADIDEVDEIGSVVITVGPGLTAALPDQEL